MFRPRGHWTNREKTLLRRARWSTVGAFAVATCMHWTSGCASTGDSRFDDAIVESEQTLPEMGSGPVSLDSSGVMIANEDSDAFRPERLSDEPRTGRNNGSLALFAPKALGSGKHDASIMDLDASLPSDAAPLLVPSGPSGKSSLAMKLDAEELKREDAQRSAVVADNDRLLAEATASLMQKPKAVTTHKRHARHTQVAKKSHRAVKHYAKRSSKSAKRRLVAKASQAPRVAPIERWKPTAPPMVASTETKTLPPSPDRSPAAAAPVKYMAAAGFGFATPTKPVTLEAKKQPTMASAEIGSAFARHIGLLMMGLGVLVLFCLFLLRKSRRENEPMDW